jgi:hypothetical protein
VIALDRLEALFREGGSTDEAVFSELLAESENTVQAMSLARALYEAVGNEQDKEGVLNAHSIYYILGGEHSIPAIEATINMLQSDLIGALAIELPHGWRTLGSRVEWGALIERSVSDGQEEAIWQGV